MSIKLEQLKKKQEQLRLQIQKEQQKESSKKRKDDTRRKILLGAMVLERMERENDYKEQVTKKLDQYLTKEKDRELFELEVK
ncbi:hypothetical protein [Carnobacterium maltaromaticum]|uniref:hypothetical protein n=1 Tax=Carnobacterium maltaromaticum TaxID=2751 RepID=UPI000C77E887|nr:hypothetical protein [Carnobacterium maltaromaticum]PLS40616.1 hypothetical protein CYV28_15615 [Carnobacterium maltaromaticum]PLS41104.1 hypothetical protein CYV32_15885 [Carnobacterium maltaromaticum]